MNTVDVDCYVGHTDRKKELERKATVHRRYSVSRCSTVIALTDEERPNAYTVDLLKHTLKQVIDDNEALVRELYDMFRDKQYVMFIRDLRLVGQKQNCVSRRCKTLLVEEFPGCLFLPIEFISSFLGTVARYNKVLSSTRNGYGDKDYLFLHFDENSIKKNSLYKRMDMVDRVHYVPIKQYQSKMTEAKIRGLCQIAEELGASSIEITFEKHLKNTIMKEATLNMEINSIAGSLGLQRREEHGDTEDHAYKLTYDNINNIELNEDALLDRIRNHKMILSEKMYHSNIELQYLLSARCRHFITTYSTTFNIDSESVVDKAMEARFKQLGYDFGTNFKTSKTISNHLKICTDIKFKSMEEYHPYINGHNVSYNMTGFNHLMLCLNRDPDSFRTKGLYAIMNFIQGYVAVQHEDDGHILRLIRENFTLEEYAECLTQYFALNSTWVQFEYFIDVLTGRTRSNDDIRYLIIYNTYLETGDAHGQVTDLVNLIQARCKALDCEAAFNCMLRPFSKKTYIMLKDLLISKYKLVTTFNPYGLNRLIRQIELYTPVHLLSSSTCPRPTQWTNGAYFSEGEAQCMTGRFEKLDTNMRVGLSLWEFHSNVVPFLREVFHTIFAHKMADPESPIDIKDKVYYNDMLHGMLSYEDFELANVRTFAMVVSYVTDLIRLIEMGLGLKADIVATYKDADARTFSSFLLSYLLRNNQYAYYTIKLNMIIHNDYGNLKHYLQRTYKRSMIHSGMFDDKSGDMRRGSLAKPSSFADGSSPLPPPPLSPGSSRFGPSPSFDEESDTSNDEADSLDRFEDSPLLVSNKEKVIYHMVKSIASYNHRSIAVHKVPLNSFGYGLIMKNYHNGLEHIEFANVVKPFLLRLIAYMTDCVGVSSAREDTTVAMSMHITNYSAFRDEMRPKHYRYTELIQLIRNFITVYVLPDSLHKQFEAMEFEELI